MKKSKSSKSNPIADDRQPATAPSIEERIRQRAYELWELGGCAHGRDAEHWHQAKLEIAGCADLGASPE